MTITETQDSRAFHYGAQGGGVTLRFVVVGSTDEAEVYEYVRLNTPLTWDGFIRQDIKADPMGGPMWKAEVEYGTSGQGGGDQPTGTTPEQPQAPDSPTAALTSGYSFSVRAPRLHLTQSRVTISATKRGGGVARDFKGKIGVDKDLKVVGCDVPPDPRATIKRTVARSIVTQRYLSTLFNLVGRTNDAPFYGWDAGEVLYLGADGQYTQGEGWSITHEWGVEENDTDIPICAGLTVPAKKGFEYLWILDEEVRDPATQLMVVVPGAAYVEEVIRPAPFFLIGVGE